ncbi:hypothetical protein IEQ34_019152 [Dendrobium chrysotoxum]|uniref:Uncharacterized protein n=1 Tax=Dendrobium chrysotoxum TaxID=161865 RepID=A0AAV7G7R9_DENCH|nr:hypothetical protein IEQ34_019152 [Dendrobium chrysotoxum]
MSTERFLINSRSNSFQLVWDLIPIKIALMKLAYQSCRSLGDLESTTDQAINSTEHKMGQKPQPKQDSYFPEHLSQL